ncbi:hypothetical protein AB395_00005556 (plasmid) [Sinorhizobium fredii CCBAU 45436]|nr:hypothetical protein AB395_00005556 [Sinorhizobium fredii CCBAU 45436]
MNKNGWKDVELGRRSISSRCRMAKQEAADQAAYFIINFEI